MRITHLFAWADQHLRAVHLLLAPLIVAMVAGVYGFVFMTGGVKFVYSHSMYLPILLAGLVFGMKGGFLVGVLGGVALGPFMPIDVATGEMQHTANWLYRTGFFVLIGLLGGIASDGARKYIAHLKWMARHDPSTRLPNRSALFDRLAALVQETTPPFPRLLVVVSVENMMELKSAFGFTVVRETISQLAQRYGQGPNLGDVYRTESTQIGVLSQPDGLGDATVLERMVQAAREPVLLNGIPIHIDTRMGSVAFNQVELSPETYLQQAETALTVAQKKAVDWIAYHPELVRLTEENLAILGSLKNAITQGQLSLAYQPKVCLRTGTVHGAEALIRWNHPQRGPLPPEAFIPRIEQSTLIQIITEFVLEQAIRQMAQWRRHDLILPVAVNISTRNLLQPGFTDLVASLLDQHGIDGASLELEITEGALMMDMERSIAELARMSELNIIISIDDFGTGYSSLQYLHRLPISLIKIDQSFVHRLPADKGAVSIVEAAVMLAHRMGIKVIAEGVEHPAVHGFLADIGCDLAQGFLISPPLPAQAFADWHRQCSGRFSLATAPS